ncbi:hypothetical protein M2421_000251 [Stenotrophomonas sp. BIGb0135]|nr:hypothetical protein [Stenotrophomonas sp. BIGb0135]
MSEMDPHDRIDLTGHMFTPEGHSLEPCDVTWWSLSCNIVRE